MPVQGKSKEDFIEDVLIELKQLVDNLNEWIDKGMDIRPPTIVSEKGSSVSKLQGWFSIKTDAYATIQINYHTVNTIFPGINLSQLDMMFKLNEVDGHYLKSLSVIKNKVEYFITKIEREIDRRKQIDVSIHRHTKKEEISSIEIMKLPKFFKTEDAYRVCGVKEKRVSKATVDSTLSKLVREEKLNKRKKGHYTKLASD